MRCFAALSCENAHVMPHVDALWPFCADPVATASHASRQLEGYACPSHVAASYYGSWFYYGANNTGLSPEQLNASLYTHVYYAFALISPTTYSIEYSDPDLDVKLMPRFTSSLTTRNPCLVPMLSVGGGSFDPAVWSAMAKHPVNRATFVQSLISFAREHGFGGVDLVSDRDPNSYCLTLYLPSALWPPSRVL